MKPRTIFLLSFGTTLLAALAVVIGLFQSHNPTSIPLPSPMPVQPRNTSQPIQSSTPTPTPVISTPEQPITPSPSNISMPDPSKSTPPVNPAPPTNSSTPIPPVASPPAIATPPAASTQIQKKGFSAVFWSPYWFDGRSNLDAQTQTLMQAQKAAGVTDIIIEWSVHYDANSAAYSSNPNLGYGNFNQAVPEILNYAKQYGMHVWVGLVVGSDTFDKPQYFTDQNFMNSRIKTFTDVAADLNTQFGSQITGFYIPVEPRVEHVSSQTSAEFMASWYKAIVDNIHQTTGKKIMISPSMPTAILQNWSAIQFIDAAKPIFTKTDADVINLQDGFEMTAWSPEQEAKAFQYAKTLTDSVGAELWADLYTPATDGNGTVPFSKMQPYLDALSPYVTTFSDWEFTTYFDPDTSRENGNLMTQNYNDYLVWRGK